jgi:hypothetical protein
MRPRRRKSAANSDSTGGALTCGGRAVSIPVSKAPDGNPHEGATVGSEVNLDLYTSAFCDPCIITRAVIADVQRVVPSVVVRELDVAREENLAREAGIRSTPTVVVRSSSGAEVFRAEGIPTVNQVLVALAKAV